MSDGMHTVTERALFQRIQRRLSWDARVIHRCRRDDQWYSDLGRYYTADSQSQIDGTHIDLEAYARELGCHLAL